MPEEELDDLFRKSASEFHPDYDPAAWKEMEKKLDGYRPPSSFWKRLSWLTAMFLTLGLGFWMSVLWLQNKEERRGLPLPTPAPSAYPAAQPKATELNRKPTTPARLQTAATPGAIAGMTAAQAAAIPGQQRQQVSANRPDPANPRPEKKHPDRGAVARLLPSPDGTALLKETATAPDSLQLDEHQAPVADKDIHADPAATEPAKMQPAVIAAVVPLPAADTLALEAGLPADSASASARQAGAARSRLGLRLLVAPDMSTVGFSKPEGISTNIGLELSYQLSPRWRLATGLLKARKVYTAEAGDYGKHGFWYNRTQPDDINAVCQVLDIPINIGYQVFAHEKSAFTINTGLSSYFMLSEDYNYYYQGGYGPSYSKTWQVRNQNRHLFSIYNLSAGYTHRLSSAMAWGIEPFIKVPLAGVGAGRVKLASGGVFLSLAYQFR